MNGGLELLISQAKNGSQDAFSQLVKLYTPLINNVVVWYCKNLSVNTCEFDDLKQEAAIALYDSLLSYDLAQNEVTFGLYSKICIRNRIVSSLRKLKRNCGLVESNKLGTKDPIQYLIDKESFDALSLKITLSLTKLEKSVLKLYILNKSYRDIALSLGKSEKSVDNAIYRIKIKLKKLI